MFSGGDGSESKPFLIKTAQDLIDVRTKNQEYPMHHYKQIADIDLSGLNWSSIGDVSIGPPFMGSYDGDGYVINALNIDTSGYYIGFFGIVTGEAKLNNIHIKDTDIRVNDGSKAGILAGSIDGATIVEKCTVQGKIDMSFENSNAGGIASDLGSSTKINMCSSNVEIQAHYASGFAVFANGEIKNSFAIGEIKGIELDGELRSQPATFIHTLSGTVENCYTSVRMTAYNTANSSMFLFAGDGDGPASEGIRSCYSDITVGVTTQRWIPDIPYYGGSIFVLGTDNQLYFKIQGQDEKDYSGPPPFGPFYAAQPIIGNRYSEYWQQVTASTHPEARTIVQMQKKSSFVGWDFENIWSIDEGSSYPQFKLRVTKKCKRMPLTNYRR
ncbi:hypothetical protein ACMGD3_07740 [Lysinibacillus sphaericus]|uniref:hypothetical protein n=1 Tax=Lysinibacillus sphaericus TaxID=1421 RepID=UPI003F796D98